MQIINNIPSFAGQNTYNFVLTDTRTGEIKQDVTSHNLITRGWWESQEDNIDATPIGLVLGDGEGVPSFERIMLFNAKWAREFDSVKNNKVSDELVEKIITVIFPASAEYVGNITEAGLYNTRFYDGHWHERCQTHCLITDAENHPITINKTENDKLTVTVTYRIKIPRRINDFNFFSVDKGNFKRLWKDGSSGIFYSSSTGLVFLKNRIPISSDYQDGIPLDNKNITYENNYRTIVYNTQRMLAAQGNTHYYPCLTVQGIGYYTLPNNNVFPPYPINAINIGIGDGVKTKFKNPLNYFMKDTDVIYINGQPKQRGVDYTIDNENNFDMLNELSAGNWIKKIYSEADGKYDYYVYNWERFPQRLFSCVENIEFNREYLNSEYADDMKGRYIQLNVPLYIELEELKKINSISLRKAGYDEASNDISNISIKLEYSNDKNIYKEAFTSENFNLKSNKVFHFKAIEALYWKMTIIGDPSNKEAIWMNNYNIEVSPFLGYIGDDQITFKTPPALDDVITMDVQMDIPFKNENYSLDASVKFEFI